MDYLQRTKWLVQTWCHSTDAAAKEEARATIYGLDDPQFLDSIRTVLGETRVKEERATAYWMLKSLVLRAGCTDAGSFLMERVGQEKGATIKMNLLRHIGIGRGKGLRITDATNALACLAAKMRNLRSAALEALGCCVDPRAEEALIRIVTAQTAKPTESGWYLYEAAHSLSEVATERALPCAVELLARVKSLSLDTRKDDIKAMAMRIICRVGGAGQVDVYCASLRDGSPAIVKWHAMKALAQHAGPQHVGEIVHRIRTMLTTQRVIPQTHPLRSWGPDMRDVLFLLAEGKDAKKTELQFAIEALMRLEKLADGDTPALFRKHWNVLTETEKEILKVQLAMSGEEAG